MTHIETLGKFTEPYLLQKGLTAIEVQALRDRNPFAHANIVAPKHIDALQKRRQNYIAEDKKKKVDPNLDELAHFLSIQASGTLDLLIPRLRSLANQQLTTSAMKAHLKEQSCNDKAAKIARITAWLNEASTILTNFDTPKLKVEFLRHVFGHHDEGKGIMAIEYIDLSIEEARQQAGDTDSLLKRAHETSDARRKANWTYAFCERLKKEESERDDD
jgi:hypothetical protein